ncbi:hypothetical protein QUA56_05870 [Microcoleus sp. N3A4]|uniref:hypothetical protein n=1 Tax=Microcoleus sp. N3A4 TaxID=3055379 RepID=UPI002FD27174
MANFSINIAISQENVTTLKQQGFKLFGFKAVNVSVQGGSSVIWFETNQYLASTDVKSEEKYQAYISQDTQISPQTPIQESNSADIELGQRMTISTTGSLNVTKDRPTNAVSVVADTWVSWTTGLNQLVDGVPKPLCAVPILSGFLDQFVPIKKVLLMLATRPFVSGTVIVQAFSPGILIDLTGVGSRKISFDIGIGWGSTEQT